ncbi:type II toxin-antitoxin system HicA family toxin [Candidatus Micrarchaeota archaeon]|nr:type II toxin-antitoxin system HicA family toxin [Candidatus Micrarchaeota archaeon]
MPKLPIISGREMIKLLQKQGFEIVAQKGSHVRLKKITVLEVFVTVVPVHGNSDLKTGLLLDILKQTGIERDDFIKLLKK